MAKLSINERLAQLINEKNMGLKASSVADVAQVKMNIQASATKVTATKPTRTDSVDIKNMDVESVDQPKIQVATQQAAQQRVVSEENPFLHNQVVDDIAKKMLKAFVGS